MKRQAGYVLPLLLISLFTVTMLWAVDIPDLDQRMNQARIDKTGQALAEARQALIAYAMSYDLDPEHAGNPRIGLLPCPDRNNDGSSDGACGVRDDLAVGRLPFRTIAVPQLRDGDGDCLWYVVAGRHKNNPDSDQAMNWDTPGQFDIVGYAGTALTGGAGSRAIAVVIAPHRPLTGVQRANDGHPCPGGSDATAEIAGFVESIAAATVATPVTVGEGQFTDPTNNDSLTWVTVEDVFGRLLRSNHFATFLAQRTSVAADAVKPVFDSGGNFVGGLPAPENPVSSSDDLRQSGNLPDAGTLSIAGAEGRNHDDWREMYRYVRCVDASPCLTVNGAACRGMLAFGGTPAGGQTRPGVNVQDYFEEPMLSALTSVADSYSAADTWDQARPTEDSAACIN